jgi:pyruvate dehydrogenase E1 component
LAASAIDVCHAYHLSSIGELEAIVRYGAARMRAGQSHQAFFYLTVAGEDLERAPLSDTARDGAIHGMYLLRAGSPALPRRVQLLGSGASVDAVLTAATTLEQEHAIAADVWSVTSYPELARNGGFGEQLDGTPGPIVAASDYARALPERVRACVPPGRLYRTLGTDGFRWNCAVEAQPSELRIDAPGIVRVALEAVEESLADGRIADGLRTAAILSQACI